MKFFWFKVAPLILALGWVAGCSTTVQRSGVTVTITSFKPDAGGALVELTLNYLNENIVDFAVSNSDHKVFLDGVYAGSIHSKEAIGLAKMRNAKQIVTLTLEKDAIQRSLSSHPGPINYRLVSVLHVNLGEERIEMKTSSTGQIQVAGVSN